MQSIGNHLQPIDIACLKTVSKKISSSAQKKELRMMNASTQKEHYKFLEFGKKRNVNNVRYKKIVDKIFSNKKTGINEKIKILYNQSEKSDFMLFLLDYISKYYPEELNKFLFYKLDIQKDFYTFDSLMGDLLRLSTNLKHFISLINKVAPTLIKENPYGIEYDLKEMKDLNKIDPYFYATQILNNTIPEIQEIMIAKQLFLTNEEMNNIPPNLKAIIKNSRINFSLGMNEVSWDYLILSEHPDNCSSLLRDGTQIKNHLGKIAFRNLFQTYIEDAKKNPKSYAMCFIQMHTTVFYITKFRVSAIYNFIDNFIIVIIIIARMYFLELTPPIFKYFSVSCLGTLTIFTHYSI